MIAGPRAGTIRSNLLGIVIAALLPIIVLGGWQGWLAFDDSRTLVANRLRANAWAIAESERDPFIIARHALSMARRQDEVLSMTKQCSEMLAIVQQGATGITNFIRTDANGKAQCSVLPFTPGQDLSHSAWWQGVRYRRTLSLSKPQIGELSGRQVLVMVEPLFSPQGAFQGTISAGINLEQLQKSLEHKKRHLPGIVFVADSAGETVLAAGEEQFASLGDPRAAQFAPQTITAMDGKAWIYVSAPLFGEQLYAVYAEPKRVVSATALSRMWLILILPLLAIVLSFVAIWFGTQYLLLRWLARIHRLTERFARGDFAGEESAYRKAPDEIAELAEDLHAMARSLEVHERELREALAVKTALTREVNHRVKNNLQIVVSLLTMQAERAEDPWAREMLGQAKSRIAALGLIHRLLYEAGRGGEQGTINFRKLIGELCMQLRAAHRHQPAIELECFSEDVNLSVDFAVPVTLFAVEAITNAYRHAFEPGAGGRIQVRFKVSDGQGWMEVSDNGHGFLVPEDQSQMGLDLIRAFAEQLGGKVEIASSHAGAVLTLAFPLHDAQNET